MSHNRYSTLEDYLAQLHDDHKNIIESLRKIFLAQEWVTESVKRDCLHFSYPNEMWVYVNTKVQKYPVLGVSRGAKMITMYPALGGLFDEVLKVVWKVYLPELESVEVKGIQALADLCAEMPKGMWVL